jgi:hypothetical protein
MLLVRLQRTQMGIRFGVFRLPAENGSPCGFSFGNLALLLEG